LKGKDGVWRLAHEANADDVVKEDIETKQ